MFKNIKDCMSQHVKLVPNKEFVKKLDEFIFYWVNKRPENIDAISTNLVGVHKLSFTAQDTQELFNLVGVENAKNLYNDIISTKGIETFMSNATKPSYQVIFYSIHLFLNSDLSEQDKEKSIINLFKIFGYQSFGSMYAHFFSNHTPPMDIAKATLNRMSFKFLLKRLGSWDNILIHRASDFFKGNKLYNQTLRYSTDDSVKVINECQSKLKDIFKNNYQILRDTIYSTERIKTTGLVSDIGDEDDKGETMNDVGSKVDYMSNNLNKMIHDKNNFIKSNIIELICALTKNLTYEALENSLNIFLKIEPEKLYKYIDTILLDSVTYLKKKNLYLNYKRSLHTTTTSIINFFKSSTSAVDDLKIIKNDLFKIYNQIYTKKSLSAQIVVIGVMTYVALRGLLL